MHQGFAEVSVNHDLADCTLDLAVLNIVAVLGHTGELAVGSGISSGEASDNQTALYRSYHLFKRGIAGLDNKIRGRVLGDRFLNLLGCIETDLEVLQDTLLDYRKIFCPESVCSVTLAYNNTPVGRLQCDSKLVISHLLSDLPLPEAGAVNQDTVRDVVSGHHSHELGEQFRREDDRAGELAGKLNLLKLLLGIVQMVAKAALVDNLPVKILHLHGCELKVCGLVSLMSCELNNNDVLTR